MTLIKRIVLVEDDPDDRDLFVLFYANRTDIRIAAMLDDGLELSRYLDAVPSAEHLPDLIVLDQNMPRMNGKQTLKFLKSDERLAAIPAVIYSTHTDSSLILECMQLGAARVVLKPIDEQGYTKMMDEFLQILTPQKFPA